MLLVMGDWNAKIGCGVEQPMVGGYGLGSRNERGDLLVDWCHENSMVVTNTWFKNHPRRLYTWRSPDDLTTKQMSNTNSANNVSLQAIYLNRGSIH